MESDDKIEKHVLEQLEREPFFNASEIRVAVKNGQVTLSGRVNSYSKKLIAEIAVRKIPGVQAIADELQIAFAPETRSDTEIMADIHRVTRWHVDVSSGDIKIHVEDGVVKLEGNVAWNFLHQNVQTAVEKIPGVCRVLNLISIKPKQQPMNLERKISAVFHRFVTR
jgi:osmotically-inducible protein OsmY